MQAVLSLWPGEPDRRITRAIGVGLPAFGFALTLAIFFIFLGREADDRIEVDLLYEWIEIGDLTVDLAIQIDVLSVFMMLIITGVGSLILPSTPPSTWGLPATTGASSRR